MNIKKSVGIWLLICAAMVMLMATIGAVTRLTESALSIVRWEPITGAVPPTDETAWQREFDLYKTSPQYQKVNQGMELQDFKKIYFWEWLHRLWGRLIGIVFAVPFAFFWWRGALDVRLKKQGLGILALGALQGGVGMFMVMSGLVDRPEVSHYRLAMHLMLAVFLFIWIWALAISILQPQPHNNANPKAAKLFRHGAWTVGILLLTITWGAFTAGLDAGLIYNSFPLMNGHFMPPEAWDLRPALINLVENHATVQWFHRCLAYLTAFMVLGYSIRAFVLPLPKTTKKLAAALLALVVLQVALGAVTVITQVKIHPAVTHQFNAFLLLGCLVWNLAELRKSFRVNVVV